MKLIRSKNIRSSGASIFYALVAGLLVTGTAWANNSRATGNAQTPLDKYVAKPARTTVIAS